MTRRENWLALMWDTLNAADELEFNYGQHDCVRLAARVLDAITHEGGWLEYLDLLYRDKRRALRLIMSPGGLEGWVSIFLGEPVPRALVRRGDLVLTSLDTGPALGVCVGDQFACAAWPRGVRYLKMHQAELGWRI